MSHPAFSIITVVYNDRAGLEQTYESICSQSFHDFEWLVVDGGSTDGSTEFLATMRMPAFSFVSERDGGIYDAMNKGIRMSHGEYVVFLNAGDVFSDATVLSRVAAHLRTLPGAPDLVLGGANLSLPNGNQVYKAPRDLARSIWHGLPANHQAIYFRRDRLDGTDYDLTYRICGDYYLVSALYKQGVTASRLDGPLVDFRVGDTSFKNPGALLKEPFHIQEHVLKTSLISRTVSLVRRAVATAGLVVLSAPQLRASSRRNSG